MTSSTLFFAGNALSLSKQYDQLPEKHVSILHRMDIHITQEDPCLNHANETTYKQLLSK